MTLINLSRILKGAFEASLRVRDWSIKQKSVPTGTPEVHQCQGWSELQVTSRAYVRLSFSLHPTPGIPTSLLTDCPCRIAYRPSKKSTNIGKTVKVCAHFASKSTFASALASNFNIVSMITFTLMQRIGTEPFFVFKFCYHYFYYFWKYKCRH